MFNPNDLIDQTTGEFDWTYIKRHALLRAQRVYADCAPPVSAVRSELLNLKDLAFAMRAEWRRDHGLPDDTIYESITPYGKQVEGVRVSRF